MRKLTFLLIVALLVGCGGAPTNKPLILPTSSGQLVVAPPTRAAGGGDATPSSSDTSEEDPLPIGEGGVILPENIPGLEKTPSGLPVYRVEVAAADWAKFGTVDRAAVDALANTEFPAVFSSGTVQLQVFS